MLKNIKLLSIFKIFIWFSREYIDDIDVILSSSCNLIEVNLAVNAQYINMYVVASHQWCPEANIMQILFVLNMLGYFIVKREWYFI